jgi:flavin reductase (DIM6/NTAB) family NADH-FMN oxidoreductase RutF
MPVSSEEFRTALSRFASGVTVVTTKDAAGRMHGLTVSAFCSVSLDPPLVLVCIEKAAGSHNSFFESELFAVNILTASQQDLSERFASQLINRFQGIDFSLSEHGLPVLADCLVNLECKIVHSYDGGDHTVYIGEVLNAETRDGDPLLYFRSDYRSAGE